MTVETVSQRDLEAIVSASGKIKAKTQINISADRMGRVVRLAVEEGDRVKAGQFLLQIDPRMLRTVVQRGEANMEAQRRRLQSARVAIESAQVNLRQAQETLARQRELWKDKLTTRELLEQAENTLALRQTEIRRLQSEADASEQQIRSSAADLASARHDLSLVTVESPIDGIIVRRNIEEGETAVTGTMNQPGTVLLTVADMSVIETEVEVDETDLPLVKLGQKAKVTIDALPDQDVHRHGHRDRQQPDSDDDRRGAAGHQLQGGRDDRRPDSRGAARVHLHGRHHDGDAPESPWRCRSRR